MFIYFDRIFVVLFQDAVQEARLRAAGLVEELLGLLEQRRRLYSSYDDAVNKFKSSKDSSTFTNARKKVDGDYRSICQKIAERQAALAKDQPDSTDKVHKHYSSINT